MKRLTFLLLVVLLAGGCDYWLTPPLYAVVDVFTQQPNGDPIPKVPLTLYTGVRPMGYATTDAKGHYKFKSVPTGNYGVQAIRPDPYRSYVTPDDSEASVHDDLSVTAGSDIVVRFVMTPCIGTVRVLAADSSGAPIRGVMLDLYRAEGVVQTLTTGSDGVGAFTGPCVYPLGVRVDPGHGYTVVAGRGTSFVDGLTLGQGETLTITFVLPRA